MPILRGLLPVVRNRQHARSSSKPREVSAVELGERPRARLSGAVADRNCCATIPSTPALDCAKMRGLWDSAEVVRDSKGAGTSVDPVAAWQCWFVPSSRQTPRAGEVEFSRADSQRVPALTASQRRR